MTMTETKVFPNLASASVSAASRASALLRDTHPECAHSAWVAQQPLRGHRLRQPVRQKLVGKKRRQKKKVDVPVSEARPRERSCEPFLQRCRPPPWRHRSGTPEMANSSQNQNVTRHHEMMIAVTKLANSAQNQHVTWHHEMKIAET